MKHSYYPIKQILNSARKEFKIVMEENKLKDVIRDEMDKVTKMLIENGSRDAVIITKWLQSLQRINDVCKERNRY